MWRDGKLYDLVTDKFLTKINSGGTLTDVFDPVTGQYMTEFGGSTSNDRWDYGSVGTSDPLSMADTPFICICVDVRHDSYGAGTGIQPGEPRIIDKSDGENFANGWGLLVDSNAGNQGRDNVYGYTGGTTISNWTGQTLVELGPEQIPSPGEPCDEVWCSQYGSITTFGRDDFFWRNGRITGTDGTKTVIQPDGDPATNLAIGNCNHSTTSRRQWDGLIRRVFVWGRFIDAVELQRVTTKEGAWDFFELYGRKFYSITAGPTATTVPSLDITISTEALTDQGFEEKPIKVAPPGPVVANVDGVATQPWNSWASTVSAVSTAVVSSGTTSQRPTNFLYPGRIYFDTTLNKPIWYNGTRWVDNQGNDV